MGPVMAPLKQGAVEVEKEATLSKRCRHHWIIESPAGATSKGVCKVCGEVREFHNYVSDFPWEDDGRDVGSLSSISDPINKLVFEPE